MWLAGETISRQLGVPECRRVAQRIERPKQSTKAKIPRLRAACTLLMVRLAAARIAAGERRGPVLGCLSSGTQEPTPLVSMGAGLRQLRPLAAALPQGRLGQC